MTITKLSLINYRNHDQIEIDTDSKFILISGQNGTGKTNLLEAISLLSPGRGLRTAKFEDIISKIDEPANEWAVCSMVNTNDDANRIATGFVKQSTKRVIKVNETILQKQSEVLQYLKVIWLTPQMDGIFIDSPSARRKLIDRLSYNFYPEHAIEVAKYEHFIRSRIKLLTAGSYDEIWVTNLEKSISEAAMNIAIKRVECINLINKYINELKTSFIKPQLLVKGQVEDMLFDSEEDIKAKILEHLKHNRFRDAKGKRTNFGTHTSDLKVINIQKNINANLCSTGEQKGMLVSMVLAQILAINELFNNRPIVLFDEVFAHLDEERRTQLAQELKQLNAQIWITTTEPDLEKIFDQVRHIIL